MIKIDGSNISKMPTELHEYYDYARTDTKTLNGGLQRNQTAKKRVADLTWKNIKAADVQTLMTWAETLTSHTYLNDASGKYVTFGTFTALITITDAGGYLPGGAYSIDSFSVNIREV